MNLVRSSYTLIHEDYLRSTRQLVKLKAAQYGIELIHVPAGTLQPLDVGVVGKLQAKTDSNYDINITNFDYCRRFQYVFSQFDPYFIRLAFCAATKLNYCQLMHYNHLRINASDRNQAIHSQFSGIDDIMGDYKSLKSIVSPLS